MEKTTNRPSGKSFSGDKRRLLEFAGLSPEQIEKLLTEKDSCEKCEADPCECPKEEEEEVKECACGCDPAKCKCAADCKCGCNKKDD